MGNWNSSEGGGKSINGGSGGGIPRSSTTVGKPRHRDPSDQEGIRKPQASTPDVKRKASLDFAMELAKSAADGIKARVDAAAKIGSDTKLETQMAVLTALEAEAKTVLDQITKGYQKIGQPMPENLKYPLVTPRSKTPVPYDILQYTQTTILLVQLAHKSAADAKQAKVKATPASPESQADSKADGMPEYLKTPPKKAKKTAAKKGGGAGAGADSPAQVAGGEQGFLKSLAKRGDQSPAGSGSDSDHDATQSRAGSRVDGSPGDGYGSGAESELDVSFTKQFG